MLQVMKGNPGWRGEGQGAGWFCLHNPRPSIPPHLTSSHVFHTLPGLQLTQDKATIDDLAQSVADTFEAADPNVGLPCGAVLLLAPQVPGLRNAAIACKAQGMSLVVEGLVREQSPVLPQQVQAFSTQHTHNKEPCHTDSTMQPSPLLLRFPALRLGPP